MDVVVQSPQNLNIKHITFLKVEEYSEREKRRLEASMNPITFFKDGKLDIADRRRAWFIQQS
jgi:hypothetical protein